VTVVPLPRPAKPEEPATDKRTVFVVKVAAAAAVDEVATVNVVEVKRVVSEEEAKPVPVCRVLVRTSSCTKEEVDAILIQCSRLSRSSSASGKASSGEYGASHRRYARSPRFAIIFSTRARSERYRSIKTSKSPRFAILFPTKLIEKVSKCISEISRDYHCSPAEGSRASNKSPPQLPGIEGEN
jgi:hypothetical protein